MANTQSAEKAARQALKRHGRNVAATSKMRTAVRSVLSTLGAGNKSEAQASYKKAVPVIDAMVSKGMVHRNKAARHKSRLAQRINALS